MSYPRNNFERAFLSNRAARILLALLLTDLALIIVYLMTYEHSAASVVSAFHLDFERNVPATYSAIKLVAAGAVALVCAVIDRHRHFKLAFAGYWMAWLAVGSLLILMGVDEYIAYHEGFGQELYDWGFIPNGSNTISGYAWPWTVYGAAFAVLIGIPLAILIWNILSDNRGLFRLLLLAGFLFVAGALGFENIRVYMVSYHEGLGANVLMVMEEFCEMAAVSLVVYVFLRYRAERLTEREKERVSFSRQAGSSEGAA